jgi:ribosome recycling factor
MHKMDNEATEPDLDDLQRRMDGAVDALKREFAGLRAGRASASLLDPITVDAYGAQMPINQVGTINVPEPRMLSVQVWDKGMVKAVEKAIRNSGLGLNPAADGNLVRVPLPELSEERRNELVKIAHKYAEQARVAVRNVRRDGMEQLKKLEKEGHISQDDHKLYADEIQELTDKHVGEINAQLDHKEKDILTV